LSPEQSWYFKNDAAHIFVSEEIVARELQVVLRTFTSQKKGSLRQPAKKRVSPACVILASRPVENRRPINDHPPTIAGTGGLRTFNAADNRSLCAVLER